MSAAHDGKSIKSHHSVTFVIFFRIKVAKSLGITTNMLKANCKTIFWHIMSIEYSFKECIILTGTLESQVTPSFQVCSWLQGVKFWTDIQVYCLVIWPKDCWAKQCWWRLMYIFVCLQAVKNCNIKGFFLVDLKQSFLLRLQTSSNCCEIFTKRWQSRVNGRENCEPSCQHW